MTHRMKTWIFLLFYLIVVVFIAEKAAAQETTIRIGFHPLRFKNSRCSLPADVAFSAPRDSMWNLFR